MSFVQFGNLNSNVFLTGWSRYLRQDFVPVVINSCKVLIFSKPMPKFQNRL
ncbi:hypothetical protein ACHAW6_014051 [Cyclotella cf. meneghiniana]